MSRRAQYAAFDSGLLLGLLLGLFGASFLLHGVAYALCVVLWFPVAGACLLRARTWQRRQDEEDRNDGW